MSDLDDLNWEAVSLNLNKFNDEDVENKNVKVIKITAGIMGGRRRRRRRKTFEKT